MGWFDGWRVVPRFFDVFGKPEHLPPTHPTDEPTIVVCINEAWRDVILAAISRLYYADAWRGDTPPQEISSLVSELSLALLDGCTPETYVSQTIGDMPIKTQLVTMLEIAERLDVKYRLNGKIYEPVIDLVESCVNDAGGSGGGGGGYLPDGQSTEGLPSGAVSGGKYGKIVTLCDAMTVLPQQLINATDNAMALVESGEIYAWLVELITSSEVMEYVVEQVSGQIVTIRSQLNDPLFYDVVKDAAWRYFADPYKNPTRTELVGFSVQMPPNYQGANMSAAFLLMAYTIDLGRLNSIVKKTLGNGVLGDCAEAMSEIGRTPYNAETQPQTDAVLFTSGTGKQHYIVVMDAVNLPLGKINTMPDEYLLPFALESTRIVVGGGYVLENFSIQNPVPQERYVSLDSYGIHHIEAVLPNAPFSMDRYAVEGYDNARLTADDIVRIKAIVAERIGAYTVDSNPVVIAKWCSKDGFAIGNGVGYQATEGNGGSVDAAWIVYEKGS